MTFQKIAEKSEIKSAAPCRVDLGGTLDISTFYIPLCANSPSCFNIAMDMRTYVTVTPWSRGVVRVSSKGFHPAEFPTRQAPYDHPLGLIFAIADYFDAGGIHIHIESDSPPRSALGGSSTAAVAVAAALFSAGRQAVAPETIAWTAHYIESSVAGVPCGMQDQLAAVFGGANQWYWILEEGMPTFKRNTICSTFDDLARMNSHILVAYCGKPHISRDVNTKWVRGFIRAENREKFQRVAALTESFSQAVKNRNFRLAAEYMNKETALRLEMTPEVLDKTGKILFEKALEAGAGARFTGAGGGGCLWSVGEPDTIIRLRKQWADVLADVDNGEILDTSIDTEGITIIN